MEIKSDTNIEPQIKMQSTKNNPHKKLIAFDIDGTLLNSQGFVLPSTVDAIKKLRSAGHVVTIATGRSYFLAEEIIRSMQFENYLLVNGAAAFLDNQQVVKEILDRAAFSDYVQFASGLGIDVVYQNLSTIRRYHEIISNEEKMAMNSFKALVPDFDDTFHLQEEIYQGIAFYSEEFDQQFARQNFAQFDFVRWHPFGVDIIPKGNSKARGLLKMADAAQITPENIIVFGDGNNDLEMIQAAGIGVAMANGQEHVRAAADIVTDSNDDNGIFNALRKIELI